MKMYLAGPIANCGDDEAMDWRERMRRELPRLGILPLDPIRRDYRGIEHENLNAVVALDLRDVRNADVVFVHWSRVSAGTAMEIFYAHSLGKPIVLVDVSGVPLSPWIHYHATHITTSINQALAWVAQYVVA